MRAWEGSANANTGEEGWERGTVKGNAGTGAGTEGREGRKKGK